jgi:succinate dehydrogenase flavin-adding protein (antitoxin of CptAB toxin-antitoxin module)
MTHPLQDLLIQHYRQARRAWAANRGVREAATLLGMTERAYYYAVEAGGLDWYEYGSWLA